MSDQALPDIPVPSGWAKNVRPAVLHVISLAHYAIACARGWAANSINARVRLTSDNHRLKQDNQLLREELRIKDTRLAKTDPRRGPYYPHTERMAILELKAVRGWSLAQAARVLLVEQETIASWLRSIDEYDPTSLVAGRESYDEGTLPAMVVSAVESTRTEFPGGTGAVPGPYQAGPRYHVSDRILGSRADAEAPATERNQAAERA